MSQPVRARRSSALLVAFVVLAVVAIAAVLLSGRDGRSPATAAASPSPAGPSSPPSASSSAEPTATSPGESPSATPALTDTPPGVARWTAVTASAGPSARSGHSWTVDPSSATAYLFGGRASAAFGDVWAYDLSADRWLELRPGGSLPTPRFDHGAAWVDGVGLLVFGGMSDSGPLRDLWAFDPVETAWQRIRVQGDAPPAGEGCIAERGDGRAWLLGAASGDAGTTELWVFDPGRSTWSRRVASGGPGGRIGAACWWSADDRFAVYGGQAPGSASIPLGDVWVFDPKKDPGSWTQAADLASRHRAGWTTTAHGGVVAAGIGEDDAPLADVVVFDPRSLVATQLRAAPGGPAPRSGPALADDPEGERTLMFGGLGADGPLSDLWALDLP